MNDEYAIRKIINNQEMINGYFSHFISLLKSNAKVAKHSFFGEEKKV